MSLDQVFVATNLAAVLGWLALATSPWRRGTPVAVARAVGAALCVAYVVMFVATKRTAPDLDLDYSLTGLASFFAVPGYRLVGWIHYLAFDLWVGAWEAEEASRSGVPAWALLLCLLLTFLLGPVGLLAFLVVRSATAKRR